MPMMAVDGPMPSQITSSASSPIAGVAWPMLARAVTAGAALFRPRRVSAMPSGIAMISTQKVEIAVSLTCCHQRTCTLSPASEFSAIESRSTLEIHR